MRLRTLFLGILAFLFAAMPIGATEVRPDPTLKDLSGAWIGPDEQVAYFRLQIDARGQGFLVVTSDFPDSRPDYYEVIATDLKKLSIGFRLRAIGGADPTVKFAGSISRDGMALVWSGVNHGTHWKSPVSLQREDHLLEQIQRVRKASLDYRARAKK